MYSAIEQRDVAVLKEINLCLNLARERLVTFAYAKELLTSPF
jgi:hypothetical protein